MFVVNVFISAKREYHVYTGSYKGVKLTVASHGVGASGANVLFYELITSGAKVIIRAGTCGSFGPRPRGSHIIATASVRNDGFVIAKELRNSTNFPIGLRKD